MDPVFHTSLEISSVKSFSDARLVANRILSECRGFKESDVSETTTKENLLTMLVYGAAKSGGEPMPFIKKALEEDVDRLETRLFGEARKQYELMMVLTTKQYRRQIQCLLYGQLRSLFRQSRLSA